MMGGKSQRKENIFQLTFSPESVIEWFIDFYPETKKKGAYQPKECVLRPGIPTAGINAF